MRHDPRIRQTSTISRPRLSPPSKMRAPAAHLHKSYLEPSKTTITTTTTITTATARRSAASFPFAFYDYDDYDSDSDERASRGFLAWGTDELDRLLAGSGSQSPTTRNERMFYGAVNDASGPSGLLRKSTHPGGVGPDPTVIPGTNMFGFLSSFGFRGKGMRYKPSAANLQEHPQRSTADMTYTRGHGRQRSGTESSLASQGDSLRSRMDLWPSEDEDDAVVIGDDAFPRSSDGESTHAMGLGIGTDDDDGVRYEDLLIDDGDARRRMWRHAKRLTMQRGLSSDSMEESKARSTYNQGSSSAPPTILATSPPGSIRSYEAMSIQQRSLSPLSAGALRKEMDNETPRAHLQMRQVSAPSPIHTPSSPRPPSECASDSTPRASASGILMVPPSPSFSQADPDDE
ncbi:hypothetical protein BZA05DRAFT_438113 [Tricharina praecox]|uniref:uncharacterized protein n=1 Tax=Tricharina praecox TaxID=43433 RepID=UPI00221F5BD2|nr:uncharacterized protein BZA05DRAFT_438113 [Tricharina praecox]KAI5847020.1 hypothetical protein BZA05DRAFT_438113 [Tricharina praecox]